MATIADAVFDAALDVLRTTDRVQLVTSASSVLVDVDSLSSASALWSSIASGSAGGRKLTWKASAVNSQAVSSGGSISKLRLLDGSSVIATASVASAPVNIGSSDTVNIGTFTITLSDPA